MRRRGWRSYSVAVALLVIQVGVSALGTIGMCVDRPHTHGGVPAPDCLMHQRQVGDLPGHSSHRHHDQHDTGTSTNTATLACSCSSDPLTLFTTDIAVIPIDLAIELPDLSAVLPSPRTQSLTDVSRAPLAPPPRPSLS
jgi:hypothetical protein